MPKPIDTTTNITGYQLTPITEMRLNPDGKTATTVRIHHNTNQVHVVKVTDHVGRDLWVITGWK